MGVMQVTHPLKPQDSRSVVYLADGYSKKKPSDIANGDGEVSLEKFENATFKTGSGSSPSAVFHKDSPSFRKRHEKHCERHGIAGNLNIQVVETSKSDRVGHDSDLKVFDQITSSFPSKLGQKTNETVDINLTNRVYKLLEAYQDRKGRVQDEIGVESDALCLRPEDIERIEIISNDIEGEIVRRYSFEDCPELASLNENNMKRVTRRKAPEIKVQTCGRGRPRKKSFGKRGGNSCDKQSQDGSENGEGRTSRGRQQRGGGQGNGGNGGGRRRRDDDDRDDDNDDIEDDFDDNNEDEDEEEDEQTGTESVIDETELTPEQEAEMAQELLCLIPPKNMNCDPTEKPAKPGTVVNLHGVVLHETTGGLVVLNVRWRNKIYSGALIDVRKSRWASERIKPDPYPEGANVKSADLVKLNGKRKARKAKSPELIEKDSKEQVDVKSEQTFKEPTGIPVAFKRPSDSNNGENADSGSKKKARFSPPPIECPEPNCGKRYSHKNGLKYHQAHAHQNKPDAEETKPTAAVTALRTSVVDSDPTSTATGALQKTVMEEKAQASPLGDVKGKANIEICMSKPGLAPNMMQGIMQFSGAVVKPKAEIAIGGITPMVKIKTEEENAVESIKDMKFEEADKNKEALAEVPKIMLESSPGEEPTELIGASDGGRVEMQRPDNLFSGGSQASLMPFNSRVNYAQFSPTLNPLNPQTLNNSLSNALQTATTKSGEKFESDGKKRAIDGPEAEKVESCDDTKSKLRLDDLPVSGESSVGITLRRFGCGKDIKCEDDVPSSPDDHTPVNDILPGSLGAHLFLKDTKSGTIQSTAFGNDTPGFPTSTFSVSLYNQLRQEHATRLFTSADSVAGDLAEPSDIQRAINQVDVRRHFSPMLLNYLNTGPRARETAPENDCSADEVSTSSKGDGSGKSTKKMEGKDASNLITTTFAPIPSAGRGDTTTAGRDRATGVPQQKPEFLQPNISVGRPIVKPATKPESITGGLKSIGGANRFGNQGNFPGEKTNDESSQGETQMVNEARSGTPKSLSPTSYVDKQMIEAKTWVPKEIYWQPPQKKGIGAERTQCSPGKEKIGRDQSTPIRMGSEVDKKSGSPPDHGAAAAEYIKNRGSSPSQSSKRAKQGLVPYPSPVVSGSSIEGDRGKQLERVSDNSQDSSEVPRFTLSGERSVSSPAENRGRPRKIRVEKTQQIPVGSAKDIEGSRGAPEHSSRKQSTTCTYTRTSVIHSMSTPPEDMRPAPTVKEEYVSPDGKRKSPAVLQDRISYDKKTKQDFRKVEASRIFEAEREKLKTRHVESHYANEVRNMQLRAQEMQAIPKGEMTIRGSLSPSSRFQSLAVSALEKGDRHARERLETKSIPVSPAYGQGSSYSTHPSDMEKYRSDYLHELHRLSTAYSGSIPEGYPGLTLPYTGSSYYGQRPGISQADSIAHQRFEQMMSSHMEPEKEFAKYEKGHPMKLAAEANKHPHADRLRPSSRDGHSSRPSFYPHASPHGFHSREPSSAPRSPKGSPFGYRLGEMLAASRAQRIESDIIAKDSKTPMGHPYGSPFFQPSFQYPSLGSSKPYSQRMGEQRSPYKHPSEIEKSRYPSHTSSQAHSGPGGMLSANLVLTQADSLGYGSVHYDNRNPDQKK